MMSSPDDHKQDKKSVFVLGFSTVSKKYSFRNILSEKNAEEPS